MQSARKRSCVSPLLTLGAMGALVFGGAGCALLGFGPQPTVVSEAPAPVEKPEPYVLLRLGERRVYLMEDEKGQPPEGYQVAIGREEYKTPTGRFRVNEMIVNPDFRLVDWKNPTRELPGRVPPGPNNPLGLRWIGFAYAHGWTIGFHGTSKPQVLGQAVSHGCVRMRNTDVVKLYERVKIGTAVVVEP